MEPDWAVMHPSDRAGNGGVLLRHRVSSGIQHKGNDSVDGTSVDHSETDWGGGVLLHEVNIYPLSTPMKNLH